MDRKKWLEDYPKTADPRVEGRIYLQDFYDQDSIAVDQSVYLALKERSGLPSVRESEEERIKRQTYYLLDAFDKWKAKCEQEGLSSIKQYDEKYSIHYPCGSWLGILKNLLISQSRKKELRSVEQFVRKNCMNLKQRR